jgi:nucleotide-binding universal stress UspA family protein
MSLFDCGRDAAGYDGSPGAEAALRWAVREAKQRETELTICLARAPQYLAVLGEPFVYDLARRKDTVARLSWPGC